MRVVGGTSERSSLGEHPQGRATGNRALLSKGALTLQERS